MFAGCCATSRSIIQLYFCDKKFEVSNGLPVHAKGNPFFIKADFFSKQGMAVNVLQI